MHISRAVTRELQVKYDTDEGLCHVTQFPMSYEPVVSKVKSQRSRDNRSHPSVRPPIRPCPHTPAAPFRSPYIP
jgi:hypothetical protein